MYATTWGIGKRMPATCTCLPRASEGSLQGPEDLQRLSEQKAEVRELCYFLSRATARLGVNIRAGSLSREAYSSRPGQSGLPETPRRTHG